MPKVVLVGRGGLEKSKDLDSSGYDSQLRESGNLILVPENRHFGSAKLRKPRT